MSSSFEANHFLEGIQKTTQQFLYCGTTLSWPWVVRAVLSEGLFCQTLLRRGNKIDWHGVRQ